LSSWIAVATLLNHQEEAVEDKLKSIFDHVYAGLPDLRGDRESPYSKPNFVDLIIRPGQLSITEYEHSLLVQMYMFKADNESFAPALRRHLISRPEGEKFENSVMDTQSYLWHLIDYYKGEPWLQDKASVLTSLHSAKDARNLLFHAEIIPPLDRKEDLFQSFIEVCNLFGLTKASSRISETKSQL
jgi:hypothetical protein